MDTKDRKRRNSYLNNILSSTGHIMRLVNSLLDLSRLNEAKETLNEIPFRLDTFLSDIEKEYGRIANDKGIMLSGDFIGTDITVNRRCGPHRADNQQPAVQCHKIYRIRFYWILCHIQKRYSDNNSQGYRYRHE